jgi:hypothetical protein
MNRILNSLSARQNAPDDELSDSSVPDQFEDIEPAEDEGEKMAKRIWDKVVEGMSSHSQ